MYKLYAILFIVVFVFWGCKDNGTNLVQNLTEENKTHSFTTTSSIPLGQIQLTSSGEPSMNRTMSLTDPMRDPNWDWTEDKTDTLYATSYDVFKTPRRPYFDENASIEHYLVGSTDTRDIWPEDGWRLVLRDFGTPQYDTECPFFILYNKNLGILRYFFFGNQVLEQINYASGTLYLQDQVMSPLFTLTDSTDQYLNDYNIDSQHTISAYYHDTWNFMDFNVPGFDPDIDTKYARFIVEINAYKKFKINESGTMTLNGVIGSGGSTHSQLLTTVQAAHDIYTNISKGFKDVKTAQQNYADMLNFANNSSNAWWSGILSSLSTIGASQWIPALGPLVGVSRFIMGGGSSLGRQPTPIALTGGIRLEGELYNTTPIGVLRFAVPSAKVDNPSQLAQYNELPFYDKKPGIFNVNNRPYITATAEGWWRSTAATASTITLNTTLVRQSNRIPEKTEPKIKFQKPADWDKYEQEAMEQLRGVTTFSIPGGGGGEDKYFNGYVRYDVSANYTYNTEIFSDLSTEGTLTYIDREAEPFVPKSSNGKYIFTVTFEDYQDYQVFINSTAWKQYFNRFGIKATLNPSDATSNTTPVTILKAFHPSYGSMNDLGVTQ